MRLGRTPLIRQIWTGLCLSMALLLTGCGGVGTKYNEFRPQRILLMGDEVTYIGCTPTPVGAPTECVGTATLDRYTINNTADNPTPFINNWVQRLAANYGLSIDKIIEPLTTGSASDRRLARVGAKVADVDAQAAHLPAYQTGDMLVIAGGIHDILCVLNADSGCTGAGTLRRGLNAGVLINAVKAFALTTDQATLIMAAAQSYQDVALKMVNTYGHRNIFLTPVYDFSNTPDRTNFCSTCSADQIQQAVNLFNLTLKSLTDDQGNAITFSPGQPRILLATGTSATDSLYVNITTFTTVQGSLVYNFITANSVCGSSHKAWTVSDDHPETWNSVTKAVDYSLCQWNGSVDATEGYATNPDFITVRGGYLYTADYHLTPQVHNAIGSIFYSFMRGYQGW